MLQSHGVIYIYVNSVDGKEYIGQTTSKDPEKYCRGHIHAAMNGSRKLFHRAIRKHGPANFSVQIVWTAFDQDSLDKAEDLFILSHNTLAPNGYNLKGGGSRGKFSEIAKKNLSDVCLSPLVNIRKKTAMKEVWLRPSHRDKIATINSNPIVVNRRSAAMTEVMQNPLTRNKLKIAAIAQMADPTFLEQHAARMTAVMNDPIVKDRHKSAYEKPETKIKLQNIGRGTCWINNGEDNRKIMKSDPLPSGWVYGSITPFFADNARTRGRHTRWHVRRGIISPDCPLCQTQDKEP